MILIILSSVADTTLSSEEEKKKYFVELWINFISHYGIIKVKEKGVNKLKCSWWVFRQTEGKCASPKQVKY